MVFRLDVLLENVELKKLWGYVIVASFNGSVDFVSLVEFEVEALVLGDGRIILLEHSLWGPY